VDAAAEGLAVPKEDLIAVTEGQRKTSGVYEKTWR